jgi:hypothetical protein
MEECKKIFGSQKVMQLGYVFKDIKKQAMLMESLFGIPPFAFSEGEPETVVYRGKESVVHMSLSISRYFNMQLELLQWNSGECLYKEFLDQGREGLHHISLFVQDLDKYIEEINKMGIEIIQSGVTGPSHWVYLDTEETFGIIIEVQEIMSSGRRRKREKQS